MLKISKFLRNFLDKQIVNKVYRHTVCYLFD